MCERCNWKDNSPYAQAIQEFSILEWIPRVDPAKQPVYIHQSFGSDNRVLRWRALNLRGDDAVAAVRTIEFEVVNN